MLFIHKHATGKWKQMRVLLAQVNTSFHTSNNDMEMVQYVSRLNLSAWNEQVVKWLSVIYISLTT